MEKAELQELREKMHTIHAEALEAIRADDLNRADELIEQVIKLHSVVAELTDRQKTAEAEAELQRLEEEKRQTKKAIFYKNSLKTEVLLKTSSTLPEEEVRAVARVVAGELLKRYPAAVYEII